MSIRLKLNFVCILLACVGCAPAGPVMYFVSGKVTWNKAPLENGSISFEPLDNSKTPSGEKIINGSYSLRASAGKCRVRISATRPGKNIDAQMGAAPPEQYIPAKYNSASDLEFEVKADSSNQKNFDLEM